MSTANITVQAADFTDTAFSGRHVTMTPQFSYSIEGNNLILGDRLTQTTDANGQTIFSGVVSGNYTLDFIGPFKVTSVPIYVNATGNLNAKDLISSQLFTGLPVNRLGNVLYVTPSGNNSTATKGAINYPFKTLTAAANAATSGDTIVVYPGLYTGENDLLRNNVNWYFSPGAKVAYVDTGSGLAVGSSGWGIFDDRPRGACTSKIDGYGDFSYGIGTGNFTVVGGSGSSLVYFGNRSGYGAFIITNSGSDISLRARQIDMFAYNSAFQPPAAVVAVFDCKNFVADIDRIVPTPGMPNAIYAYSYFFDPDTVDVSGTQNVTAIWWGVGNCHIRCNELDATVYGIYCAEPTTAYTSSPNFWYEGNEARAKIYTTSGTTGNGSYRSWIKLKQLITPSGIPATTYQGGRHYLEALKIQGSDCIVANNGANLWVTAQKVSTYAVGNKLFDVSNANVYANVSHLESIGTGIFSGTLAFSSPYQLFLSQHVRTNSVTNHMTLFSGQTYTG